MALLLAVVADLEAGECIDYREHIVWVAGTSTGQGYDVAVGGGQAYVAEGYEGLQIIDVTDLHVPYPRGSLRTSRHAMAVAENGAYACVTDVAIDEFLSSFIHVVDVSDPDAPVIVGSVETFGTPTDIAMVGSYAYVTERASDYAGASRFFIIDLSVPESPSVVGEVATTASSCVAVAGTLAYIGGGSQLAVVDVSEPSHPAILGTSPAGRPVGLATDGAHVYVADLNAGLVVFDVSDPMSPSAVGVVQTPDRAAAVAVSGALVFVAAGVRGLQVIDVSDPSVPRIVGNSETLAELRGVVVSGSFVYLAGWPGLQIVDYSNPTSPDAVGRVDTPEDARSVAIDGSFAFVADGSDGLRVIDLANPTAPVIVGGKDTPGFAAKVKLQGRHAFVADSQAGMQVIDVSILTSPEIVGSADTGGTACDLVLAGHHAFVANGYPGVYKPPRHRGLAVLDISDPTAPKTVARLDTLEPTAVEIVGDLALLSVMDLVPHLLIIDISDATHPTVIGTLDRDDQGSVFQPLKVDATDVRFTEELVYMAYDHGLTIIDLANPEAPRIVGKLKTNGIATEVVVVGNLVYLADAAIGLKVIDVSDPISPRLMGGADTGRAEGVALTGSHAVLADGGRGLTVFPLQCPIPVPVELSGLEATSVIAGIRLAWQVHTKGLLEIRIWRATGIRPAEDAYSLFHREREVSQPGRGEFLDTGVDIGETYSYRLEGSYRNGEMITLGPISATASTVPMAVHLSTWPNPSPGGMMLGFDLPSRGDVTVKVYDLMGRCVRRLHDGPLDGGRRHLAWDGRDGAGHLLANGSYVVQLLSPWGTENRRVILLR